MTTQEIRSKLDRKKGEKARVLKNITTIKQSIRSNKTSLKHHEQAREIIRTVGQRTQEQLSYHISDITSLALEAVFPNAYELTVDFVPRRNKTECDLMFYRDGNKIDPFDASGGGAVDVAAFALRIASWSMEQPKSRNVIILDEPLKHLSTDYQEKASTMIKQISEKLGIQFIIVTHETVLATFADRIFETRIRKGVTYIKQS